MNADPATVRVEGRPLGELGEAEEQAWWRGEVVRPAGARPSVVYVSIIILLYVTTNTIQ